MSDFPAAAYRIKKRPHEAVYWVQAYHFWPLRSGHQDENGFRWFNMAKYFESRSDAKAYILEQKS